MSSAGSSMYGPRRLASSATVPTPPPARDRVVNTIPSPCLSGCVISQTVPKKYCRGPSQPMWILYCVVEIWCWLICRELACPCPLVFIDVAGDRERTVVLQVVETCFVPLR